MLFSVLLQISCLFSPTFLVMHIDIICYHDPLKALTFIIDLDISSKIRDRFFYLELFMFSNSSSNFSCSLYDLKSYNLSILILFIYSLQVSNKFSLSFFESPPEVSEEGVQSWQQPYRLLHDKELKENMPFNLRFYNV